MIAVLEDPAGPRKWPVLAAESAPPAKSGRHHFSVHQRPPIGFFYFNFRMGGRGGPLQSPAILEVFLTTIQYNWRLRRPGEPGVRQQKE